jgi:hypothetical protein
MTGMAGLAGLAAPVAVGMAVDRAALVAAITAVVDPAGPVAVITAADPVAPVAAIMAVLRGAAMAVAITMAAITLKLFPNQQNSRPGSPGRLCIHRLNKRFS